MCDRADAPAELFIIDRGAARIEPGEFAELDNGAAHDEAATRVLVRRVAGQLALKSWHSVLVFEHRGILKRERVAIKTKLRSARGAAKNREYGSGQSRTITPDSMHGCFLLR